MKIGLQTAIRAVTSKMLQPLTSRGKPCRQPTGRSLRKRTLMILTPFAISLSRVCGVSRIRICVRFRLSLMNIFWSHRSMTVVRSSTRSTPFKQAAIPLRNKTHSGYARLTSVMTKTGSCANERAATPISCQTSPTITTNGSGASSGSSMSRGPITTAQLLASALVCRA